MRFRSGHIEAESNCYCNAGGIKLGKYDLLILGASWDSRCVWMEEIQRVEASLGIMVTYTRKDSDGRQDRHRELLDEYLGGKCEAKDTIIWKSEDIRTSYDQIYGIILELRKKVGRPVSVCVDISAIPRYCFLAILAVCLKQGLTDKLTYLYAEGDYDIEPDITQEVFHEGGWRSVPVPFLEVPYDPLLSKCIYVSLGFDGSRTQRVTQEQEPDRVLVLFPRPGVKAEYIRKTFIKNKPLLKYYMMRRKDIVCAAAGDAVAAWKAMHEAGNERPNEENIFYICDGTKAHALGIGLRALAGGMGTVFYYIPDEHRATDVRPLGKFWRYDIRDTSVLPAQNDRGGAG